MDYQVDSHLSLLQIKNLKFKTNPSEFWLRILEFRCILELNAPVTFTLFVTVKYCSVDLTELVLR